MKLRVVILVIALGVILLLAFQARSQNAEPIPSLVNTIVAKAKANALNASSVDWDSINASMNRTAQYAGSVTDMRRSLEILLSGLHDNYGFFYDPATKTPVAGPLGQKDPEAPENVVLRSENCKFHFAVLENNVRYLRIVSIKTNADVQQEAQRIRQAVDSLSKGDALQWIVDLRYTSGGTFEPLFAGVGPLLEEGLVATLVDNKENVLSMYTVHNGNFYIDQVPVARFPISKTDLRQSRIAVLTSRFTSGAGELLAIGLRGRRNTKIFGEPTEGHIVGMSTFDISKNLAMQIAHTMFMDRKGTDYKDRVEPDTTVEFIENSNLKHDKGIAAAISWLASPLDTSIKVGMK